MSFPALAAVRVRQWPKNLLLFAGLIFAAKIGDGDRLLAAMELISVVAGSTISAYALLLK